MTYTLKGKRVTDPTEEQLEGMTEGDDANLAPKGSKCDQWGTCHGTEPIVLPFHDDPLNAARMLRDVDLRSPKRGNARKGFPLFADKNGAPFKDHTFAEYIKAVLTQVVGPIRVRLYSPHSWRVWLASSLRMCGASDARIQAMGRWLNPASLKIYARMTRQEYGLWVDKLMAVKHIDTARTTSMPIMDMADVIVAWGEQLHIEGTGDLETWDDKPPPTDAPAPPPLNKGERLSVYWTDHKTWYACTYLSSTVEKADGGGKQRTSHVVYDAVGAWAGCSKKELTYWHCLDDELWTREG